MGLDQNEWHIKVPEEQLYDRFTDKRHDSYPIENIGCSSCNSCPYCHFTCCAHDAQLSQAQQVKNKGRHNWLPLFFVLAYMI